MRIEGQVITQYDPLNIRSGPGTSYKVVGTLPKGSVAIFNDETSVGGSKWYKLEDGRGWVSGNYIKVIKNLDPGQSSTPITNNDIPTVETVDPEYEYSQGIDLGMLNKLYNVNMGNKNEIKASTRLFGCPFQFISQTDFRVDKNLDLGRKYLENIIAEAPIVYFLPGKPAYLPDLSKKEREALTKFFMNTMKENDAGKNSVLSNILGEEEVRYFDFVSDYAEYMKYVNLLCRICSIYIGIGDKIVPGTSTKYKHYDWANYKYYGTYKTEKSNDKIFDLSQIKETAEEIFFGENRYVQFYVDPSSSFSESSSNNTQSSQLESYFDFGSNIIKEFSFLTNTMALSKMDEARDFFANQLDELSSKFNEKQGFFKRLLGMGETVLSGSNILFPEIWGDSSYGKSYNITVNLVTPYGDKESWFLNIGAPLMHLMALSLPRQSSPNSFASPFLVKVFAKGWFSCELGIVDSLSIEKSPSGDAWTVDGLPAEVRVSLGVKDLYSNLMITPVSKPGLFFQNQGLIDFLAVTCGVNVTKPNLTLKMETLFSTLLNKFMSIPTDFYRSFIEGIRNSVEGIWKL